MFSSVENVYVTNERDVSGRPGRHIFPRRGGRAAQHFLFFFVSLSPFARSAAACPPLTWSACLSPSLSVFVLIDRCAVHPLAIGCRVLVCGVGVARRVAPIDAYLVRQITAAAAVLHLLLGRWEGGATLLVKFMHRHRGALTVDTVISYFGSTRPTCVQYGY